MLYKYDFDKDVFFLFLVFFDSIETIDSFYSILSKGGNLYTVVQIIWTREVIFVYQTDQCAGLADNFCLPQMKIFAISLLSECFMPNFNLNYYFLYQFV